MEMKRKALLSIKEGLRDPFGRLSSWIGEDCCNLAGVGCSNQTGHIVDHRNKYDCPSDGGNSAPPNRFYQLGGTLNPSLLNLTHLNYLDTLPFVNFTSLQALDLSYNKFSSSLPHWLFNFSTLVEVRLRHSNLTGHTPKVSPGNLRNLQVLDLSSSSIGGEIEELIEGLSRCSNCSLETLDLNTNNLAGNLPDSWGFLRNLKFLALGSNKLTGKLSDSLGSLGYLAYLQLSHNAFWGPLLKSVGNLSRLEVLDLRFNMMSGTITESIGQLPRLFQLGLYGNLGIPLKES
ncbi:Disease resistance family protein / LRR family protein [Theobroma cacao]|uniref:Disease resistance family protein / LRR family protein n=1 Tax=Theobroma cacao TaxID=3641 RepID=A0A061E793_THECC|nr:Disease resistance family protein / LRR family protein [Theobroma cacao]